MNIEEYNNINNMKQIERINYLVYLFQNDRKEYNKYFKMKRKVENKDVETKTDSKFFSPINLGL